METRKTIRIIIWSLILIMTGSVITRIVDIRREKVHYVASHNWDKITLILQQIEQNYVDEIDYDKMTESTIPLILGELDPHSVYLPPMDLKNAEDELQGNFDGIGITFNVPQDTAIVINVIPGGPSERAGLISGDRIIKIDGDTVAGVKIPQDSLVKLMKGPSGTKVALSILRGGELVPFEITRDKIPVKSVDVAYMINDTLSYVKLSKFTKTSHNEFVKAIRPLLASGMKKMIFDIRDNSGGYLDQALLLSNEFLDAGDLILYMEGTHRPRQDFHADGSGICRDVELAVLINENSASSSEIFAGALQDNDRGTIYGRRSFGKGLVQEPIYFSDRSGIRLTVARYYTPTGRSIQKPYSSGGEDYVYDIFERYRHGEMTVSDSIPRNDSLKYTTPDGKIVYGGGGIIPDIFVPMDTVGVTDLLVKVNRQSLQVKFAIQMADRYRKELRNVKQLKDLDVLFSRMNLESEFKSFIRSNSIDIPQDQWQISGSILMIQVKAMIGRYSSMDDNAFYPLIAPIDNVVQAAI